MKETDILLAVQAAVRKALVEAANEEIEKQKLKFECEMGKVKGEMIGKLINGIQIRATNDLPGARPVIQIIVGGD